MRAGAPAGEGNGYTEAGEHVEVVRRLWDSWKDDAEIRDDRTGRFLDRALHYVDFEGPHFSVTGLSITPRLLQGQPLVAALADNARALAFAADNTDIVFSGARDVHELCATLALLEHELTQAQRERSAVRVFADITVFLDEHSATAIARRDGAQNVAPARARSSSPARPPSWPS